MILGQSANGAIGIQLPDDVIQVSCFIKNFQPVTIYESPSNNFTGTDIEFVKAGLAYKYYQISPSRRLEL